MSRKTEKLVSGNSAVRTLKNPAFFSFWFEAIDNIFNFPFQCTKSFFLFNNVVDHFFWKCFQYVTFYVFVFHIVLILFQGFVQGFQDRVDCNFFLSFDLNVTILFHQRVWEGIIRYRHCCLICPCFWWCRTFFGRDSAWSPLGKQPNK